MVNVEKITKMVINCSTHHLVCFKTMMFQSRRSIFLQQATDSCFVWSESAQGTQSTRQSVNSENDTKKNTNLFGIFSSNAMQCSYWTARMWRLWKRQIESTKQIEILFSPPQYCTLLESVTSSDMGFRALLFSKTNMMQIQITKTNTTQIQIHNDTDRTTRC